VESFGVENRPVFPFSSGSCAGITSGGTIGSGVHTNTAAGFKSIHDRAQRRSKLLKEFASYKGYFLIKANSPDILAKKHEICPSRLFANPHKTLKDSMARLASVEKDGEPKSFGTTTLENRFSEMKEKLNKHLEIDLPPRRKTPKKKFRFIRLSERDTNKKGEKFSLSKALQRCDSSGALQVRFTEESENQTKFDRILPADESTVFRFQDTTVMKETEPSSPSKKKTVRFSYVTEILKNNIKDLELLAKGVLTEEKNSISRTIQSIEKSSPIFDSISYKKSSSPNLLFTPTPSLSPFRIQWHEDMKYNLKSFYYIIEGIESDDRGRVDEAVDKINYSRVVIKTIYKSKIKSAEERTKIQTAISVHASIRNDHVCTLIGLKQNTDNVI